MPRPLVTVRWLSLLAVSLSLVLLFIGLATLHYDSSFGFNPPTRSTLSSVGPSIAGFWHIAKVHQDGDSWRAIVRDQHQRLVASGLLAWAQKVHVTLISNSSAEVTPILVPPDAFNITHYGSDWRVYEFPTLTRLYEYCVSHPESRVWFMHTFGSRFLPDSPYFNNTWAWRNYMEHFVVTHFEWCLEALDSGFNTCGPFLLVEPLPHFAGNFWWARCDYVRTLPKLRARDFQDMSFAQWWLGRSRKMRPKVCHMPLEVLRPGMGLYDSYMDPALYEDIRRC